MKKYLPYILASVLITGVILLVITGNNKKRKEFDETVTLKRQDKIPYGTYIAFKSLSHLFPTASISVNRDEPGYWDSLSNGKTDQALIIITGKFNADESEMRNLISFVEQGNDVFISARTISYSATNMMGCRVNNSDISAYYDEDIRVEDSLGLRLIDPVFPDQPRYYYPGKKLDASFISKDETITEVLGEDDAGRPDFIRLRAGKGNFYVHLAPLAFSNYFLLHKKNIAYYEKVLSVIAKDTRKVVWDEYYLNKKFLEEPSQSKQGWFAVLSRYPALKAALLTAIFTLLAYVLFEMRRKQRQIPVVTAPKNDSLDFVKTIGRLYFDKGDHRNLCRKMSAYFLEHVRSKYKLATGVLDETFIKNLQYKSGAEESEIRSIVSFIKYADDAPMITPRELTDFHKELEAFYQRT